MIETPFNRIIKPNNDIYLIPKSGKYNYVFIFIHGLHDTPKKFVDHFDKNDGLFPSDFKIILPCAPVQNCDAHLYHEPTTSWFNIFTNHGKEIKDDSIDINQLEASSNRIKDIIKEEAELLNYDYSKIFISGFSQGACASFHIGLTLDNLLGGIIGFCGMPLSLYKINENNKNNLNILVILGAKDPFFKEEYVKEQIKNIIGERDKLEIKVYENIAHNINNDGMNCLKEFVFKLLNKIE